jgi:ParB-like chromosome segregation protein Spo0J
MARAALKPNRVTRGRSNQPVNKVQWVPRDKLRANAYNPNSVAPPELDLLKISIMEDGWTQPIVARKDFEIVDGFHRWTVAGHPEIAALTDGHVPVVFLDDAVDAQHQMMSTIRHNRARGSHSVLKMADIVTELKVQGLTDEQIQDRLKMEDEEVERLVDQANMVERTGGDRAFNKGWVPKGSTDQQG